MTCFCSSWDRKITNAEEATETSVDVVSPSEIIQNEELNPEKSDTAIGKNEETGSPVLHNESLAEYDVTV
jgi:hypothetical protein